MVLLKDWTVFLLHALATMSRETTDTENSRDFQRLAV